MKSVATCTLNGFTGASFNQPSACRAKHSTITATFTQAELEWAKITSLSIFKRKGYTGRRCGTCTNQRQTFTRPHINTQITREKFVFCTHIWIKAKLTDVARNNLLFLGRNGDSKCVVDYCFLDGVHLEDKEQRNTWGCFHTRDSGVDQSLFAVRVWIV